VTREAYDRILPWLRADPRVLLVYGFGSSMRGDGPVPRDVDVAVLLDRPLDWQDEGALRSSVTEIEPRADLVVLNGAPPALCWEVVSGGGCLFARDPRTRAEFEIRSLSRFQDFQPVRRVQQRYLRARVRERRGSTA
jgi:hypothetical protein